MPKVNFVKQDDGYKLNIDQLLIRRELDMKSS